MKKSVIIIVWIMFVLGLMHASTHEINSQNVKNLSYQTMPKDGLLDEWNKTPGLAPEAPTNLVAIAVSGTQINLTWDDNSNNETSFIILKFGGETSENFNVPANSNSYQDTGLSPGMTYSYIIGAFNDSGYSELSDEVFALTIEELPEAPSGLSLTVVSPTQINLTWIDNSSNENGFFIQRYSGNYDDYCEFIGGTANTTSYQDTELTPGTTYNYLLSAYNSAGESYDSETVSATTFDLFPNNPTNLNATTISPTQINLTWNDNSNNETGFLINRGSIEGASELTISANSNSYQDTELTPGITYNYVISAYNDYENSGQSNVVYVTTFELLPNIPNNLITTVVSETQINLTWDDNSNNETGFEIMRLGDNALSEWTVSANSTSYQDTDVTPGVGYYYLTRAYNDYGYSDYSNEAFTMTIATLPNVPTNVNATAVSTTQVNLTWNDNSNNETGFEIKRYLGDDFDILSSSINSTSYQDTGLTTGATYSYVISAYNSAGYSDYSEMISVTTLDIPPATPTNLTAISSSTTQINLTWNDTSSNEMGFEFIKSSIDGITDWTVLSNSNSYQDTGLTPGETCYYAIRAYNDAGYSDYSETVQATTFELFPNAPTNLIATAISSTQINLTWDDNSINEIGFSIYRFSIDGDSEMLVTANSTSYQDTGLIAGSTYYYFIRAYNDEGSSDYSQEVSATTDDGDGYLAIPKSVDNLEIINGETLLTLSWDPVESDVDNNPLSVDAYNIYIADTPNQTDYTFVGTTSDTNYDISMSEILFSHAFFYVTSVIDDIGSISSDVDLVSEGISNIDGNLEATPTHK